MDTLFVSVLNGVAYGLLLFMLSAGLTLIFSMMGVINFAHASFYMLGAYVAHSVTQAMGYWMALLLAPLAVGLAGALFEHCCLRRVRPAGHVAELLATVGLSFIVLELVHLVWGTGPVDYRIPAALDRTWFELHGVAFPAYRGFMMVVAVSMLGVLWLLLARTRVGLVIRAALTHPHAVEALGHNLPRVFIAVFGGGAALAGLAGVIGGNAFVTEPGMAATIGSLVFVVVVVGGLGSLSGAFAASLLIGLLQTLAIGSQVSLGDLGWFVGLVPGDPGPAAAGLRLSQIAPVLPYLLLVLVLALRPRGLMGSREG